MESKSRLLSSMVLYANSQFAFWGSGLMYSTKYLVEHTGVTRRQLSFWSDKGWLSKGNGTGNVQQWSTLDFRKVKLMIRFIRAGFSLELAWRTTQAIITRKDRSTEPVIEIANGLFLTVSVPK